MIIIDMNQITLASVMMNFHMTKSEELEEDMIRHMILNSIRMYRTMFKEEYGEVVLTYDSRHYWRREIFPQYKQNRINNTLIFLNEIFTFLFNYYNFCYVML